MYGAFMKLICTAYISFEHVQFKINNISMYVCMKLFYFKHKNMHTFVLLGIVHGGARVCLASLLSSSE